MLPNVRLTGRRELFTLRRTVPLENDRDSSELRSELLDAFIGGEFFGVPQR